MGNRRTAGKRNLGSVRNRRAIGIHWGWRIIIVLGASPSCLSTPEAREDISPSSHGRTAANETISTGLASGALLAQTALHSSEPTRIADAVVVRDVRLHAADVVHTGSSPLGLGAEASVEDITLVPFQNWYRLIADECFELSAAAQPCSITVLDGITMIELLAVVGSSHGGRYWLEYSEVADFDANTLNESLTVEKDGQTIMTLDAHVTDTVGEPVSITTLTYAAPIMGAAVATAEVFAGETFGRVDGRHFDPVTQSSEHDPDTIFLDGKPAIKLSMPAATARALRCLGRTVANEAKSCRVSD